MAKVDVLIDLPDDLLERLTIEARLMGTTTEEIIRRTIVEGAGAIYAPLAVEDIADTSRPVIDFATAFSH